MQADRLEVLDIRVARGRDSDYSVVMRLGEREFPVGTIAAGIVAAVAEAGPDDQGARLFAGFTADERVRMAWNLAAALAPKRRIRLRIEDDAPELHALPWEALHDASPTATAHQPGADRDTPFSRAVPIAWELLPAVGERPLRVLTAVAAPTGLEAYNLPAIDRADEHASLAEAMALAPPGLVQHTALAGPCSLANLEAALEAGYHALHLVAHGVARRDGEVSLFLEDADGKVDRVDDSAFAAMLERLDRSLRLIVLMVCSSATRSPGDVRAGLAPKVLAAGVPAVLAMQDLMPIATGRAFTRAFYGQLWSGGEVDRAANRARATLLTGKLRGSAVPVLYSALAGNRLYTQEPLAAPAATPTPEAKSPAPAAASQPEWSAWERLADDVRELRAERGRDGCIDLVALRTGDDHVHGRRQRGPGGPFGAWTDLGDSVDRIMTVVDERGRVSVLAIDVNGDAWHRMRDGAGPWSAWDWLGGPGAQQTAAACGCEGCLSFYVVDPDGKIQSREQNEAGGSWYKWEGDWEDDDEKHLQIFAVRDGQELNRLFTLRGDHTLWVSNQDSEGEYSDWRRVAAGLARFHVVADAAGRLQVFALDRRGGLCHTARKTPAGAWSPLRSLGGEHADLFAVQREGGGLEVYAWTVAGALHRIVQAGGDFGAWTELDGPPVGKLVAVENGAGALELFVVDPEGGLHRRVGRPLTAS